MALCRRCLANGKNREGGEFAVCRFHARRKCAVCGGVTLGEELCAAHAHQAEVHRWKQRAHFQIHDPEDLADEIDIRRERLAEAKFLAHQGIEVMFRSQLEALMAIWGQTGKLDQPAQGEDVA